MAETSVQTGFERNTDSAKKRSLKRASTGDRSSQDKSQKTARKKGSGLNPNSWKHLPAAPSRRWGVYKKRHEFRLTDEAYERIKACAGQLGITPADFLECIARSPQLTDSWLQQLKEIYHSRSKPLSKGSSSKSPAQYGG